MDTINTRVQEIFLYDPSITDYALSVFATVSGTPSVSASKLLLNAAETVSNAVFKNGILEFIMTIPAVPTAGDVRSFGFKTASGGNKGRIEFDITGIVFSAKIYNEAGTQIGSSYPINWDAAWTAAATRFAIFYWERNCYFTINGTVVAKFEEVAMSKMPLAIHIKNGNADALTVSLISVA